MQIVKDAVVAIDYTLTDDAGKVIDTSDGREPLHYLHGHQNIIPGLEEALLGKKEGDSLKVPVAPEKGYGTYNEELVAVFPKDKFPDQDEIQIGKQFHMNDGQGGQLSVKITKIEEEGVTIDGNHELAGQTLNFDVEIKSVREATEEELSHGHVHGPGGHQH